MIYGIYLWFQICLELITTSYKHHFYKLVVYFYFAVPVITSLIREEDRRRDISRCPHPTAVLAGLLWCARSRSVLDTVLCIRYMYVTSFMCARLETK